MTLRLCERFFRFPLAKRQARKRSFLKPIDHARDPRLHQGFAEIQ
jgi:hypothetical protein